MSGSAEFGGRNGFDGGGAELKVEPTPPELMPLPLCLAGAAFFHVFEPRQVEFR